VAAATSRRAEKTASHLARGAGVAVAVAFVDRKERVLTTRYGTVVEPPDVEPARGEPGVSPHHACRAPRCSAVITGSVIPPADVHLSMSHPARVAPAR
jgi:hypothetical protein